jgi:hypothetical protein
MPPAAVTADEHAAIDVLLDNACAILWRLARPYTVASPETGTLTSAH